MIWCVPANNRSSTWNTSDTRFVGCVHRRVSSMFETKPHFLRICPRWFCQRLGAHRRPYRLFLVSRSLYPCWDPVSPVATRVVVLRTPVTVLRVCVEEGGVHVCSEHCVPFASEVCCLREEHPHWCWHRRAGENVFVLQVFLEASQQLPCLVWFQHPLAADDLGVCFALVHLSLDSLVLDAVEFCGFGDCL